MFGIGGGELIFIIIIALMLFGTDKIPEAARSLAKVMSQLKNATNDLKSEIQKSADEHGINDTIKHVTGHFNEEVDKVKNSMIENHSDLTTKPLDEIKQDIEDLIGPVKRQ